MNVFLESAKRKVPVPRAFWYREEEASAEKYERPDQQFQTSNYDRNYLFGMEVTKKERRKSYIIQIWGINLKELFSEAGVFGVRRRSLRCSEG